MYKKASFLSLMIYTSLSVSGCSNFYWPQHGHSGIAEHQPHIVHWHYNRSQLDLIERKIVDARQDIHILRHNGAETHFPALMHDIHLQFVLVEREFEGHFYRDAEKNIDELNLLLREAHNLMRKKEG